MAVVRGRKEEVSSKDIPVEGPRLVDDRKQGAGATNQRWGPESFESTDDQGGMEDTWGHGDSRISLWQWRLAVG